MKTLAEITKREWQRNIGPLPKDFFLQIEGDFLTLCYMGDRFREIMEPGGGFPQGTYARICCLYISHPSALYKAEIIRKVKEEITRIIRELEIET